MNLNKIYEIFKGPDEMKDQIHIIGCGAVGSCVAELLARFGFTKVNLYDFDVVESKNIANQMFGWKQIGMNKAQATKEIMEFINPECKDVVCFEEGWTGQKLNGIVIVCPDKIQVRKDIYEANKFNLGIKFVVDFRMGLWDGDCYIIEWLNENNKRNWEKSMRFNDEDVVEQRSACHEVLSFSPTIRTIVSIGVAQLIKQYQHQKKKEDGTFWYANSNPTKGEIFKILNKI